jgi:hypothetical protein
MSTDSFLLRFVAMEDHIDWLVPSLEVSVIL